MSNKLKASDILNKTSLTKTEILNLLKVNKADEKELMQLVAENLKQQPQKDFYKLEETIKISNYCDINSIFCKLQDKKKEILRFRLNREKIISEVLGFHKIGKRSIVLHSYNDKFYNRDRIAYIIYSIKKRVNIKLILSLGIRELDDYKAWKIAGADSYFLNFISSNKVLYKNSEVKGALEDRLDHINYLKKLGYSVGSGSVVNLPNQTSEDVANDIMFCKGLNLNYVGFYNYNLSCSEDLDKTNDNLLNRVVQVAQLAFPNINVRLNNLIN